MRQARNSATFWTATGHARGHQVIRRRGFLAVVGDERAGLRILIQEPDLAGAELAELTSLVTRAIGPVDAEDPFSATDLSHPGMRGRQLPVLLHQPGTVAQPAMSVTRVRSAEELRAAERTVIAAFELTRFQPHRAGELCPLALTRGRALMLASLAPLADLPATLTASRLGRPLYESLEFTVTTDSTWWSSRWHDARVATNEEGPAEPGGSQ